MTSEVADVADDFRQGLANERKTDRQGAKLLADACQDGDAKAFLEAVNFIQSSTIDAWRLAFARIGRLASVSDEIRAAFLSIWIEHKALPRAVSHRPTMAKALRILMPAAYQGHGLRLYRGTNASERRRRLYGFSWSTVAETARSFAQRYVGPLGAGLVLTTMAPPSAIPLVREEEGYFDEGEVVVDPYALGAIEIHERL